MQGDRVSTRRTLAGTAALLAGLLLAGRAAGQAQLGSLLPTPRLTIVTPCGAKAGTTVELTFTGTDLNDPQALRFSHSGIKATAVPPPPPPPPPKVDPKTKKGPKMAKDPPKPQVTKFTVTVDPGVPPGNYDVRLVGQHGVSNPRVFVVGDLAEVMEKEPNNDVEQAQRIGVGTTVNGIINAPTDVDYYVFAGKKGQRVVVHCAGATIDSRITPELKLFDASGRQVAYHRPPPASDALVDYTLPDDGDYYVRLCQFTYTVGGPEYFYRLSVSTAPWIDAVFPPMIEAGKTAKITLYGRNLPGGKPDPSAVIDGRTLEALTVEVKAPNDPIALQRLGYSGHVAPVSAILDGFEYRLQTPAGTSNPVPLFFAQAPVILENPNNDTQETAQEIAVPCEVAGRIEKRRDRDWYVFTAKKGDVYSIEVQSQRLGAPTDMFMAIYNGTGKTVTEMAQLDDDPQTLSTNRLYTLTRDPPTYRFAAPADGKYYVLVYSHLGDTLAGPEHVYRLRIAPERPDFRLIVMPPDSYRPDTCILNQGGNRNYTVFAQRMDGFKGEITLTAEGLPAGVTCRPQVIGPSQKQTNLVLTAADTAPEFIGDIKVKGTAMVKGTKLEREARPATITWAVPPQQNIPTITRLDHSLPLVVHGKAPFVISLGKDSETVTLGGKVAVPVKLKRIAPDFKAPLQIQPVPQELPQGMTFGPLTIAAGKDDGTLNLNVPGNVPPGTYNIVFRGFAPVAPAPKAKAVNVVMPSTPLTLVVLPRQVATLTVATPNPTIKLGQEFALTVRVTRQYEFDGEFKVDLVLPKGVQGVEATPVVIPAGANEAKLVLRVPTNAPLGGRPNLVVRAIATVNGNVPLTHETKINVNITK
jgi:hypothetical protein